MRIWKQVRQDQRGAFLLVVFVFGSIVTTVIMGGVAAYAIFEYRVTSRLEERGRAFHIAEAGINYYRWHLAHNPDDYADGTGGAGPYVHAYEDKNGEVVGYYSLSITPPLGGSTIVTIESTGWTVAEPSVQRVIRVRVGFPALTNFTFLNNGNMSFGALAVVQGEIHSNGGVRFDGTTNSWVKSAKSTYLYSAGVTQPGVWGAGGPTSFWQYPVPTVDFTAVTADLADIRDAADNGGVHLAASGDDGWHLVFTSTTFQQYLVTSRSCSDNVCYDIASETFVATHPIPANGAIFVEDDTWVSGGLDGRVSLGVGKFPVQAPYKNVFISGNLIYQATGGNDVMGIIAQGSIIIPKNVPNIMTIDAALLSQFSSISRPYYAGNVKNTLTIFGSQIGYVSAGYRWSNSSGVVVSGFVNTNHMYDGNLRYFPPPYFPVSATYDLISWEEI